MARRAAMLPEGWRLVLLVALAVAASAALAAATTGWDAAGLRLAIRLTARTSLFLFCTAFAAAALYRRWPNAATAWLRCNRRYLGLGFAASHLLHGIAIIALARFYPATFWPLVSPASFVFGGIAYVFIILMAATSFDRAARWLGERRWRILHRIGGWYIWLIFFAGEATRAPSDRAYLLPLLLLVAVAFLRLTNRTAVSAKGPASAGPAGRPS